MCVETQPGQRRGLARARTGPGPEPPASARRFPALSGCVAAHTRPALRRGPCGVPFSGEDRLTFSVCPSHAKVLPVLLPRLTRSSPPVPAPCHRLNHGAVSSPLDDPFGSLPSPESSRLASPCGPGPIAPLPRVQSGACGLELRPSW